MDAELPVLVDALPGLVWTALPDGRADFFNRRWLDYSGLSMEEAVGFGWRSVFHPDDLPVLLAYRQAFSEAATTGEVEARMRRHDGQYRRFLVSVAPIRESGGRVVRWCGINMDIEERSRTEQLQTMRQITEAQRLSQTGSFTANVWADEHNWSEELYRIFEIEPGVRISVDEIRRVIHPDDRQAFDESFSTAVAARDHYEQVFRIVTKRGTLKHLHAVAQFADELAGRPLYIGAIRDISSAKRAEEALSQARADLAHVARLSAMSALTASIAHEVNQPLAGIITNASTCLRMLGADPPDLEGARATATRTIRDGNRASDVIKRLRSLFARREPQVESVDLNDAAGEVIALVASELRRGRTAIRTDFARGLPDVMGDRVQLQQVILNLVLNAVEAMGSVEDRPRELSITTALDSAQQVSVRVSDTGPGIQVERMERLFDAFYTTKRQGMGIGLSVSRSIVEAHGGRMSVSNGDGGGAIFEFFVPVPGRAGDGLGERARPPSSAGGRQAGNC